MPEGGLTASDILAVHQLFALYGHLLDDDEYERLTEVFTDGAVLAFRGRDLAPIRTAAEIAKFFSNAKGSSAHHMSNVVVTEDDTAIRVRSKFYVPYTRPDHEVHRWYGGIYHDTVVQTAEGWRISSREIDGRWQLAPSDGTIPAHRQTF
jgi:hypothetical protein